MWTSWFWSPEHRDNIDSKNFGNAVFVGMPGLLKPVKLWELSNFTGWKKMICHIFPWSFPFPQVCISLLFLFPLLFNCLDNPFHSPSFNFALMLTVLLNKYRRGLQRSNYNTPKHDFLMEVNGWMDSLWGKSNVSNLVLQHKHCSYVKWLSHQHVKNLLVKLVHCVA